MTTKLNPIQFVPGMGMLPTSEVHNFGDAVQPSAMPEEAPRAKTTPPPAPKAKASAHEVSKPVDVLKLARKRLREIEAQLRAHEKLKAEREKLKRLLDAAEGRPAVVRDITKRTA